MDKGFRNERYRRLICLLVEQRQALGYSQSELASRLGTHQQFVSRYETGERRLDIVEFCDVAAAMQLDAAALLASVNG